MQLRPIRRLPDNVINKIAAGEVIERPASVVKELVENALDAGADTVEVAVEAGGKNFIQVLDNGFGMDRDSALLALDRHATSKLERFEDLESIGTLGFRGEALPAIASVSRLELRSRRPEDPEGTLIHTADGLLGEVVPAACVPGTCVTVRNLFFSTPARRKFLTSNRNELRHILNLLRRIGLVRPELRLVLVSDGEELHDWPATDLSGRVNQVFGTQMLPRLVPVELAEDGLRVSGYVGKVSTFRRSHGDQYLFVNGRPVSNRMINHAVFSAYGHTLKREQLPFYLLFVEAQAGLLDVNVHPAKKEVRFEDERRTHRLVNLAVRKALATMPLAELGPPSTAGAGVTGDRQPEETASSLYPGLPEELEEDLEGFSEAQRRFIRQTSFFQNRVLERGAEQAVREYLDSARLARDRFQQEGGERSTPPGEDAPVEPAGGERDLEHDEDQVLSEEQARRTESGEDNAPLFQLHGTYIFAAVTSGMIIVDQHVAHERVLYERCLGAMRGGAGPSQRLLFPLELELDEGDRLIFEEVLQHLLQLGFEMEMSGPRVQVTGIPMELQAVHPEGLVQEILDQYRIYSSSLPDPREALAAAVSCKAAIKAGQPLNQAEMRSLLDDLFNCHQPFTCPHGRPVVVNLSLAELNRRFDRG